MSMMCSILAVSEKQITAFRAQPSLASDFAEISAFYAPQRQIEARLQQLPPEVREQFEAAQRAMLTKDPALQEMRARLDASRPLLDRLSPFGEIWDLDKDWNVL